MRTAHAGWKVDEDEAWAYDGNTCYRHYSGVSIIHKGKLWIAVSPDGNMLPGRKTAFGALACLQNAGFWWLRQFEEWSTRYYGKARHTFSPVSLGKPMYFVFWTYPHEEFPSFVKSTLARRYFGVATCADCSDSMDSFRMRVVHRFDGSSKAERIHLVCKCGYPVWKMPLEQFYIALRVMERTCRDWRRRLMLAEGGGRHTTDELRAILECQDGRCIYCNAQFSETIRPTKDHLLPVTKGGGSWALNIVLACHSCNSRRGNLAFRTFCKVLSPTQNKRILMHMVRRLLALNLSTLSEPELTQFDLALAQHEPRDLRFRINKKSQHRNIRVNKLLPRNAAGLIKAYRAIQKIGSRQSAKLGKAGS